ncbi:flagellar hook-length control protein FliK [Ralstonia sp. ASV6]|uniref:flagellar hook-length control protein FliK n=1 Tax=Ralstonia sp. ASV6 TaxID=2795124 RepID=UPI0018EB3FF9|nr:flagellar hook-length control protein FliK [Ralstonia sp. ASV6]
MMLGMLAVGDISLAAMHTRQATAPVPSNVGFTLGDMKMAAFDGVPADELAADVGAAEFASLDALVAQMLAQVVEADAPVSVPPALQDGTHVPSHLMQALEARGETEAAQSGDVAQRAGELGVALRMPQAATPSVALAQHVAVEAAMPGRVETQVAERVTAERQLSAAPAERVRGAGVDALTQVGASPATTSHVTNDVPFPSATTMVVPEGSLRLGVVVAESAADPAQQVARNTEPTQAQQKLLDALGERLSVQTHQGMRHAVIRLDPYMSGSVRIELRQEAHGMAVHLSATNQEVVRQLQAIGESLRQDLGARNGADVTVQVSASRHGQAEQDASGGRERHARDHGQEHAPGRGLASAGGDGAFEQASRDVARMQKEST